ncbi:hypothetical protein PAXRUDRAFT_28021 [Paxillus rubicundulus Ve08.2h10]|uniref:Uncharacterized protein n=1 Tax=Paxillus rubicundulus Ve08.2h10 TaxID=930991 RepID=A0A0D0CZ90_9AGAM|nr:hypothetical protein PAXRUDRAFT_28021 [Paxillus rubicundulus Ve08.2h10]
MAVKLPETEPTRFNTETLLQMSGQRPVTGMDQPSKETHSAICFWDKIDFLEWAESPAFQENGDPIPEETFANNGWKVKQMVMKTYSSWYGRHIDDNGNWNSKKSQQDSGDEDDVDVDNTGDSEDCKLKMKKCKRKHTKHAKSKAPYKKFKAAHNNQTPLLVPVLWSPSPPQVQLPVPSANSAPAISTSLSTQALPKLANPSKAPTPQVLVSPKSVNQFQVMVSVPPNLSNENKENEDPNSKKNDSRAKKQIINHLATLATTATKAKLSPVPLPEVPSQSCARCALVPEKIVVEQKASYESEVTLLGAWNTWDLKTITQGTMY